MNKSNWIPPQLQSSRPGPNTRCQKCLKYGHFSYQCRAQTTPYVARTSRSQQLAQAGDLRPGGSSELYGRNKYMEKPSVEVPDEFRKGPAGVGLADEILKAKEEARRRLGMKDGKSKGKDKQKKSKKRSPSPSSDSDSDSDSSSVSSRSPPPRAKPRYSSTPPRSRAKEEPRRRTPSPQSRRRRSSSTSDRRSRSPVRSRPDPGRRRSRSRS